MHSRKVLDLLIEGVQIIDFDWRYLYVNEALAAYQNTSREAIIGKTIFERFPAVENSEIFKISQRCMLEREEQIAESDFEYPDKTKKRFELKIKPIEEGIIILSVDITHRYEAETKIKRANHLYNFISELNHKIVKVKDQQTLFRNACRLAIEFGSFKMAWIGLFDIEERIIDLVEQNGIPEEDLKLFVKAPFADDGPQGKALKSGPYFLCNNISRDLNLVNWKPFAEKYNINSCILLPLKRSGQIIGTLNLYASEIDFLHSKELEILTKVAEDISFTLDILDKAEKQSSTEEKLIKSERQFRHTLDNLLEGIQIIDFDWKYLYVNEALVRQSYYSKEELIGFTPMDKYPGFENTLLFKLMEKCLKERSEATFNNEFTFPDGSNGYFELSIRSIPEGISILSIDRSGKKRAEEKLLKVNRLYSFLSAVNQSIVHINDEQELLRNACSIATNIGDFKMAWIGMLDENGKLNIVQLQGDRSALQGIKNYSGMDFTIPLLVDTPTGRALRTGKYALSNQVQNDPVMEPWKDELALHGIKANISLPLIKFGKVIGVFGLNSATDNFFDEQEIKLLTEAAGDISFALELFENARRHKETEELVERNEKLFRTLIEKSGSIKALGTREGKIFYVSPSVTKYLGYTLNEFLDLSFPYLVHDDDLQEFLGKRLRILETDGSSFCQELRVKHQNGNWIWCECIITNLLNEPGINALVVNVRDISEKKTIELELEFEQNNLNALINNTTDLMWSIDKEYKIISCNEPFENYIRNASGHKISDVGMPLEQQKRHMLFLNRALTGESFKALECIDGPVERWSEISFYPIKKDNEVIGTACHSHDITNSKKAEIQLRKSEIFNRGVLNSLSSHIAVMDGSGNIVAVNEAWKRFALENETSALHNTSEGSNYFSVCEVADKAGDEIAYEVMQGMKDVLYERTKVYNLEYPSHDPEKNQWFAMRALKFESGEPMVVVSYQDITERKLGEEKLIQQNEELRKTNEELDRFVYSASHDLRAPLTSILGLVYLIEVKCLEKDTLQFTGMIKSSIHRLDGFIKNILDYARNNRTELLTEHIPLEENINGIVDSLRNMAAVNGIDFEVSITELVPFYSDQQRVNVVIGNLLSNAIKFQDLSKPHRFIKITGESIKNSLHLRVEDNGIGIPAEFLSRIFDMFFRLSGSEAGSGIGLYIVKEKVEKLKGTIEVESHEGIGTTFILKLKNLMMEEANAEDDSRTESGSAPD